MGNKYHGTDDLARYIEALIEAGYTVHVGVEIPPGTVIDWDEVPKGSELADALEFVTTGATWEMFQMPQSRRLESREVRWADLAGKHL